MFEYEAGNNFPKLTDSQADNSQITADQSDRFPPPPLTELSQSGAAVRGAANALFAHKGAGSQPTRISLIIEMKGEVQTTSHVLVSRPNGLDNPPF